MVPTMAKDDDDSAAAAAEARNCLRGMDVPLRRLLRLLRSDDANNEDGCVLRAVAAVGGRERYADALVDSPQTMERSQRRDSEGNARGRLRGGRWRSLLALMLHQLACQSDHVAGSSLWAA